MTQAWVIRRGDKVKHIELGNYHRVTGWMPYEAPDPPKEEV